MDYAARGKVHMVRFFLRNGARVDIKDNYGKTVMDYICKDIEEPEQRKKKSVEIRNLLQEKESTTR